MSSLTASAPFIIGQQQQQHPNPKTQQTHNQSSSSTPPRLPLHQAQDQMEVVSTSCRVTKAKGCPRALSPGKMAAAVTGAGVHKKPTPTPTVVHILGSDNTASARTKRPIVEHPSANKRIKTTVAEVVYQANQYSHAPPPPRTTPQPLVVGVPPPGAACKATKATKSMNAIDAQVKVTTSTGATVNNPADRSPQPSTTTVAPTCKISLRRSSAAAAAPSATPKIEAPLEMTEVMMKSLARLTHTLNTHYHLPGMAELLTFVVQAQAQSQEHATLFRLVMEALQTQPHLRKDLCDFEQVFDCTAPVYGKKPSAIFQELPGGEAKFVVPTETYHEHLFLRLWMHFIVTRLQLVRDLVPTQEAEVALVDAHLKLWFKRAYEYL